MNDFELSELLKRLPAFRRRFDATKAALGPQSFDWYPYDSLNLYHLDELLVGEHRRLGRMIGSEPLLDLGCADGAVSFLTESCGFEVHAVDHARTNINSLRAVRSLKRAFDSSAVIHEADLDSAFDVPAERYGLALFFGALYHLKNPFAVLEKLSSVARYCLLTTRIAQVTPDLSFRFRDQPMAYLLDAAEANQDATNFWVFSEAGLRRIFQRTGWDVEALITLGETRDSDPASEHADQRASCLLRSRSWDPAPLRQAPRAVSAPSPRELGVATGSVSETTRTLEIRRGGDAEATVAAGVDMRSPQNLANLPSEAYDLALSPFDCLSRLSSESLNDVFHEVRRALRTDAVFKVRWVLNRLDLNVTATDLLRIASAGGFEFCGFEDAGQEGFWLWFRKPRLGNQSGSLEAGLDDALRRLEVAEASLALTEIELHRRTRWAERLDGQLERLRAHVAGIYGSWAYRIGRRLHLAPQPIDEQEESQGSESR